VPKRSAGRPGLGTEENQGRQCLVQVARPMTKSLLERFENPVIKVNIKTGAVLMDRVREFLG